MAAQARSGRVALVLAAVVCLVWMHSLVAPPSAAAHGMQHPAPLAVAGGSHAGGHHDPAGSGHHDDLTLAHLCLAVLAVGTALLLSAQADERRTTAVEDELELRVASLGSPTWRPPPPDLVRELSISRT